MDELFLVRWQNLSGDWFSDYYPLPMAHVIFTWKCGVGGIAHNQAAEITINGVTNRWTK